MGHCKLYTVLLNVIIYMYEPNMLHFAIIQPLSCQSDDIVLMILELYSQFKYLITYP